MKKILMLFAAVAAVSLSSCKRDLNQNVEDGTLSFADFVIECDDALVTKATTQAGGNYVIEINDNDGKQVVRTTYAEVKSKNNKIAVPAGEYTMNVRSLDGDIPVAAFEQPVYGATTKFSIAAGETTTVGGLVCTLLQCKVTVDYSDDFLEMVTGAAETKVEVSSGNPLTYAINYDSAAGKVTGYDKSAGFFSINNGENTTMDVTFKGSVDGSVQKMTKTFKNIQPKQWRQVKFIKKVNNEGNATVDIVINDLVNDEVLNSDLTANEEIIGEDPTAPKGDGGINLQFDYDGGCDAEFTDLSNLLIPKVDERAICLKLIVNVPNGVKKFTVDIASTSGDFMNAVAAAEAETVDLINPSSANEIIFQLVPFPHGESLIGQSVLPFDMSAAQGAILNYKGTHTFTMNVIDTKGCKKSIPVVMVVE